MMLLVAALGLRLRPAVAGDASRSGVWTVAIMPILRGLRSATGAAVACVVLALAPTVANAERAKACDVMEPDSLGISWTDPCDEGRWLVDPQSGCRMWDWHP